MESVPPTRGERERQQPGLPHTKYRCDCGQQHIIQTSHQHHHRPNVPLQPTNHDRLHQQHRFGTRQCKITRGVDGNNARKAPPTPGRITKKNVGAAEQIHGNDEKNRLRKEATQQPTKREEKQESVGEAKVQQMRKRRGVPPGRQIISLEKNKDKRSS